MAMEQRYFGRVKAVNTTPSCLTIIPEDRNARPDYDRAYGLSRIQLADFLYAFGSGEKDSAANMRVSYVLRPGPGGMMLVQDVQRVEAVKVKQEYGPSESGYGAGEGRVKHWKGSGRVGFLASQSDGTSKLEEEALRNSKGEFRNRTGGLPVHPRGMKSDKWSTEEGNARRG